MPKAKNTQPYIDYDKATFLTRLYDFINRSNQMRKDVYRKLDYMSRSLAIMQDNINEMKKAYAPIENPNAHCTEYEDDIKALRGIAWEAGLSQTLFEKLNDRIFRRRFNGDFGEPVLKEEIEDHYPAE